MHLPKIVKLSMIMLSGLWLNGCAVGPDYQQPVTPLPESFANSQHAEFSSTNPDYAWWLAFNDPQLIELVKQTVAHNYQLQVARTNLTEARALYLEAGFHLAPQITSHGNYTNQVRSLSALNNRSFAPRPLDLYNIGFDASWEADLFGRMRRNVEASQDQLEHQEANLRDVGVSLIAEVARNYFQLRGLQQQLQVAEKNAENQVETLAVTQAKLKYGRGTELDTSRALAQLETTKASIPALQTAISQAIHRLSVLTGQIPDTLTAQLTVTQSLPKIPDSIQIGNPAELLKRRPDIRMAERDLATATAMIGVATADFFPRVSFVGNLSLEASTLANLGAPGSNSSSFGPRISWAFLDVVRISEQVKAAGARAEESLALYQQTVLNALEETENALVAYHQERLRQQRLAAAAAASEKANHLAHLRYQAGVADFLTVLDTELKLLQDQNQLAQSETSLATALTAIYKALGGGWEILAETAADGTVANPSQN